MTFIVQQLFLASVAQIEHMFWILREMLAARVT
jgi:hypothetical protein